LEAGRDLGEEPLECLSDKDITKTLTLLNIRLRRLLVDASVSSSIQGRNRFFYLEAH